MQRRFSNNKKSRKRSRRRSRRSKKKGILRKRRRYRKRKTTKHVTFARGTNKPKKKYKEPKLLTAKQKRERGYSRKYKYCLGPEFAIKK